MLSQCLTCRALPCLGTLKALEKLHVNLGSYSIFAHLLFIFIDSTMIIYDILYDFK